MAELKTPGVYIQEMRTLPPTVAQVATAIPAFIGYTEIAPADPVRIRSMAEFVQNFGGPYADSVVIDVGASPGYAVSFDTTPPAIPVHSLYFALQMYFANGGGPCWVVSAGVFDGSPAAADFTTALDKVKLEDEPTLIVMPESVQLADYAVIETALAQCAELQDRFTIIDLIDDSDVEDFRDDIGVINLKYGAAYMPHLLTNLIYPDSAVTFSATSPAGILGKTLAEVIEEAAAETTPTPISDILAVMLGSLRTLLETATITLPPSSTMAGVYAAVDASRGVWKAPANVSLRNVIAPTLKLNDEDQEDLNIPNDGSGKSINAIRSFTGKGVLVWGARTLDGNSNEWRYIPVRRLFNVAEESIRKATEFVVFEPNVSGTWALVRGMIQNYLITLWRQGALAGAKPEDAFFVKVGLGETMTPQDIIDGKLVVDVGLAAVRPAEFIVLRFSHKLQES